MEAGRGQGEEARELCPLAQLCQPILDTDLQNCKRVDVCCFKPVGTGQFVTTATGS